MGANSMHMADALISPGVAGVMWATSAATICCCSAGMRDELDDRKVPLMGVLGAFLFAAQMINFSIPGTGSSGHLGGGLLLAILLGPGAAFLTIASVLVVQALFFADGGLLALGCNIFNMGAIPALVVFPLFYRRGIGRDPGRFRLLAVTVSSAVVALQLGSFAVVLETVCSGRSALPFPTFLLLMQPIHLAIGVVEGVVTVAVVSFVAKARPGMLQGGVLHSPAACPRAALLASLLVLALATAGVFSLYASHCPDGLEWAVAKAGAEIKTPESGTHLLAAALQEKTAFMPGYSLGKGVTDGSAPPRRAGGEGEGKGGTGAAGVIGTLLTLTVVLACGLLLKKRKRGAC